MGKSRLNLIISPFLKALIGNSLLGAIAAIEYCFEQQGLSLDAPYLNSNSVDFNIGECLSTAKAIKDGYVCNLGNLERKT